MSSANANSDYRFDVNIAYDTLSRSLSGFEDRAKSTVDDVAKVSFGVNFLPDTYNVYVSFSHSLTESIDSGLFNPFGFDDKAKSYHFSMIPWFDKEYGGVGIFFNYAEQNAKFDNRTGSTLAVAQYDGNTSPFVIDVFNVAANQSFQSKESASYLGLKYLLPARDYLPEGFNVYYSTMDRETVYYGDFGGADKLIHIDDKGKLYGFGIQRELKDLPEDQFSLHLLQISIGGFDGDTPVDLSEYTAGVTYKMKDQFVKLTALIYVVEDTSFDFGTVLRIPKQTDVFASINYGMLF